ncbi:MAG: SAM-dependent methyltransferase [Alphaproteobacteria bacterium]|nr:SAM-dependent methyltransferase [Alphaproteobacteria bacterium]OJV13894.1 MAG: hypothetical protein BGO27_08365 [Alphaproteobacteria bacterium 33-17]
MELIKDNVSSLYKYLLNLQNPLRLDSVMEMALYDKDYGYYSIYNPFENKGDFITAPKISQMFGEIVGAFGLSKMLSYNISKFSLIEIGGGDGTLLNDILKIIPKDNIADIYLVDNSDLLKSVQQKKLAGYNIKYVNDILDVKTEHPCFIVANELFDAMPIRKFKKTGENFFEAYINSDQNELFIEYKQANEDFLTYYENVPENGIIEYPEYALNYLKNITRLLESQKGFFLTFDYGYLNNEKYIFSMQAIKNHTMVDWLLNIGSCDITTHVDFKMLMDSLPKEFKSSVTTQGGFLLTNGIGLRARALIAKNPDKYEIIDNALSRLTHPKLMGELFKCMLISNL